MGCLPRAPRGSDRRARPSQRGCAVYEAGWLRKLTTHPGRPRRCPRRTGAPAPVIGRPPEPPARPVPEPAPAFGFGSRRGFPVRMNTGSVSGASTWAKWSRRRSTTLSRLRGRFNAAPPFGGRSSSSLSQRRAPHRRHSCSSSPSSSPQTEQIWMVGAVMPLPLFSAEAKGGPGCPRRRCPALASPVASRCNLFWSSLVSLGSRPRTTCMDVASRSATQPDPPKTSGGRCAACSCTTRSRSRTATSRRPAENSSDSEQPPAT